MHSCENNSNIALFKIEASCIACVAYFSHLCSNFNWLLDLVQARQECPRAWFDPRTWFAQVCFGLRNKTVLWIQSYLFESSLRTHIYRFLFFDFVFFLHLFSCLHHSMSFIDFFSSLFMQFFIDLSFCLSYFYLIVFTLFILVTVLCFYVMYLL